jgi:hypothetical protein
MTFDFRIEETRENHTELADEVYNERCRQRGKWGQQAHDLDHWLVILGEEYGEACEWALEARAAARALDLGGISPEKMTPAQREQYKYDLDAAIAQVRSELIQVAAVSMAIASGLPSPLER